MGKTADSDRHLERRYQRASCNFPAEFVWGTVSHRAVAKIISIGGCYLASEVLVPNGEELELLLRIDLNSDPIRCLSRVAWVSENGIVTRGGRRYRGFALEFERIYPEERARIDEFVKKRTRVFRTIEHEMDKAHPDKGLIKELFATVCPGESTHMNHIRKACREELRHFRLRR